MGRVALSIAGCVTILAGCSVLSGGDEGAVADPPTTAPTTVAPATPSTSVANGAVTPFWVVEKSPDGLSQRLAYNHPQLGPSTIAITYDEVPKPGGWVLVSVQATVDGSDKTVFDWTGAHNTFDRFEFAGAPQFEPEKVASRVPSPVDGLGHVFFDWGNTELTGVSYLVPVADGFDDHGTFADPFNKGVYGATVGDADDDGNYDITRTAAGCAPSCPFGGDQVTLAWDGTTYSAREAPATTQPTSPPAPTQPPAQPPVTPPPAATTPPAPTGPRYEFFTTPQLGVEPVRGSGCGGDGTLGDIIPDGWWYGFSYPWGPASFEFDVVCIYFGESARPHVTECTSSPQPDLCLTYFSEDFWMVNNNDRTRTVALSPNIETFNPAAGSCPGWDVRSSGNLALIRIVGGRAVSLETRCPDGY